MKASGKSLKHVISERYSDFSGRLLWCIANEGCRCELALRFREMKRLGSGMELRWSSDRLDPRLREFGRLFYSCSFIWIVLIRA